MSQSRESGKLNDWVHEKLGQKAESGALLEASGASQSFIQSLNFHLCKMGAHSDAVLYKCDALESSRLAPLQLRGAPVSDTDALDL